MRILLLIMLSSFVLSSAQLKTVPSEFPEGTLFFDTGYPKTLYLGETQGEIFATFTVPIGSDADRLYFFSKESSEWQVNTNYTRQEFGQIRKVVRFDDNLVVWTTNAIYVTNDQNQLQELKVPFREYPLSVNEFGYKRNIADLVVKNDKLYLACDFLQRFNQNESNVLQLSEILILNTDFTLENYFRTHSDRFQGFNDVDSIPYGLGVSFLHVKNNGDIIATGQKLTIQYYDDPDFLIYKSSKSSWSYESVGYPSSEFGEIKFTPQFLALNVQDEEIIAHNTRNPNTDMIFYKGTIGWESFGTIFSENPLPNSFIDFRSTPRYNGYVNLFDDDYLYTSTHGLISFDDSELSFNTIFVHDEDLETAFISNMVVSGDIIFAELQPINSEPSRLYKLEMNSNSINDFDSINNSRIIKELYFDTVGNRITENELEMGKPYLKLIKYSNGQISVKKLIK